METTTPPAPAAAPSALIGASTRGGLSSDEGHAVSERIQAFNTELERRAGEASAIVAEVEPGEAAPPRGGDLPEPLIPFEPLPDGATYRYGPEDVAAMNEYVTGMDALGVSRAETTRFYHGTDAALRDPRPAGREEDLAPLLQTFGEAAPFWKLAAKLYTATLPAPAQRRLAHPKLAYYPDLFHTLGVRGMPLVEPYLAARDRLRAIVRDPDFDSLRHPARHAALVAEYHATRRSWPTMDVTEEDGL